VALTIDQPATLTLSFAERKALKVVVDMPETVKAPIAAGQSVGKLVVSAPGLPDQEYPLKTANAVERLGFFPRIGMAVGYLMGSHPNTAKN
jgi:D-alanyl-D-alanine carboxypeptidase (penicillin-binding protein 5/6)